MHRPSKDDVKNALWRWRCKILGTHDEKTLSDYSNSSGGGGAEPAGGAASKPDADAQAAATAAAAAAAAHSSVGSAAAVKTLYEGESTTNVWQDYPPRQLSKAAAKQQERVAIKVYKVRDQSKPAVGGRYQFTHHQIEVQNPLLLAALAPILREREELFINTEESHAFEHPFRPLYFAYDALAARLAELAPGGEAAAAAAAALCPFLKLLLCVLDEAFAEVRAKRRALEARGLVAFAHLWTHYPRGAAVRSHGSNCEVLSRVVGTRYERRPPGTEVLVVTVQVLRFHGEAFVWETRELVVPSFEGNRPLAELEPYPVDYLPAAEQAALTERTTARGRLVLDCQGLAYRQYSGVGLHMSGGGGGGEDGQAPTVEKHNVDGRVLVDVVGYNKHHKAMGAREGHDPQTTKNTVAGTGRMPPMPPAIAAFQRQQRPQQRQQQQDADRTAASAKLRRLSAEDQARNRAAMLARPDDLKFLSPLVEGYALKNKMWFAFYVEDLRPIAWNDRAYDHLVYDEQQKDLVLSFVESHGHTDTKLDDVIMGKGEGLILLLSGPPGTGKTLMAEAVADRTHRPLFYLQAEDLGINAAALGANVKRVFEMATEWDAVILLDEADVFMAERHPQDIARNELVSIFLRELEYFRGIIFLTTNLYDTIDSAFRSRVSLHLLFRPLSAGARLAVWRKFMARIEGDGRVVEVGEVEGEEKEKEGGAGQSEADHGVEVAAPLVRAALDEEDLVELSAWNLNGREIKTAVKMVTQWCAHKGLELTLERLENGIRVTSPHASKAAAAGEEDLYD